MGERAHLMRRRHPPARKADDLSRGAGDPPRGRRLSTGGIAQPAGGSGCPGRAPPRAREHELEAHTQRHIEDFREKLKDQEAMNHERLRLAERKRVARDRRIKELEEALVRQAPPGREGIAPKQGGGHPSAISGAL